MYAKKPVPLSCSSGLSEECPCSFLSLLPSLALTFCFVWGGGGGHLPYFFLRWELFHRDGSCLCITEAKEALKAADPRLELPENWLAGCLVLHGHSPFPFTSTTASWCSADLIPKESFSSLVLCRNLLPFVLGLINISY